MQPVNKARILFCDDDEDMLKYFKALFAKTEHAQVFVNNGMQALEQAKKNKIDIAFIDINMPGIDGLETLAKWKEIQPGTQIIIVSSYSDGNMVRVALERGAYTYLFKPLKKVDVFAVMVRALKELMPAN